MSAIVRALVAAMVCLLGTWGMPANAATAAPTPPAVAPALENALQVNQYRIESTNPGAPRQVLTCWQVTAGAWNNQSLSGLSLVLVQQLSEDGRASSSTVYVSDFASKAQRQALLAALAASHPALFADRNSASRRVEPADIQIEMLDPQTIILHLGLMG